jgi:hypothetical protein
VLASHLPLFSTGSKQNQPVLSLSTMYTGGATVMFALALSSALVMMVQVNAQLIPSLTYCLKDSHIGYDFLDAFVWETEDDLTHGRVNYVDKTTALKDNLTFGTRFLLPTHTFVRSIPPNFCLVVSDSKFVMRADDMKKVANTSRGRDSIRIHSLAAYDDALFVLDLTHMPEGCSTWPAWWTLSQAGPWPQGGEIDIIEGVNLNPANLASLHTTPNCTMPQARRQKGFDGF